MFRNQLGRQGPAVYLPLPDAHLYFDPPMPGLGSLSALPLALQRWSIPTKAVAHTGAARLPGSSGSQAPAIKAGLDGLDLQGPEDRQLAQVCLLGFY